MVFLHSGGGAGGVVTRRPWKIGGGAGATVFMNELGGGQSLALGGERATTQFTVVIFAGVFLFLPFFLLVIFLISIFSIFFFLLTNWNSIAHGSAIFC